MNWEPLFWAFTAAIAAWCDGYRRGYRAARKGDGR